MISDTGGLNENNTLAANAGIGYTSGSAACMHRGGDYIDHRLLPVVDKSHYPEFTASLLARNLNTLKSNYIKYKVLDDVTSTECLQECRCPTFIIIDTSQENRVRCLMWVDDKNYIRRVLCISKPSGTFPQKLKRDLLGKLNTQWDRETWQYSCNIAPLYEPTFMSDTIHFPQANLLKRHSTPAYILMQETTVGDSAPKRPNNVWLYWEVDGTGKIISKGAYGS